jgi:hypothetical protein
VRTCRHLDDAGAVDKHIDRPALTLDRRSASLDAMLVADIGGLGTAAELRSNNLRFGDIAIDDNEQIAAAGKFAHTSRANAAGASGHDADALH